MKNYLLFALLLLTVILILSSCGGKTSDPTSAASTAPGETVTPTEGESTPPTAGETEPVSTEPSDEEFIIFAPGTVPSVVYGANATGNDRAAADTIRSMIRSATGASVPAPKSDGSEAEGAEIVIGLTTRPVSQAAKAIFFAPRSMR